MKKYLIPVKRTSRWDTVVVADSAKEAKDILEEQAAMGGGFDSLMKTDSENYVDHEIEENLITEADDEYEGSPQWFQDAEQS